MRDHEATPIHGPRRIVCVVLPRAMDEDILDITPCQIRIRLQNQSYNSRDKGSSTRGSSEVVGHVSSAVSSCSRDIRGCYPLIVGSPTIGVSGNQNVCPRFRVPRLIPVVCNSCHCNRISQACIPVVVRIVISFESIPSSPCVYVSEPGPSIVYRILNGCNGYWSRSFQTVTTVVGAP